MPPLRATILILDAEPQTVELIRSSLDSGEYRLLAAQDVESGMLLAQHAAPDVLIVDPLLSPADPFEFCRRLRVHPDIARIPLIIVSSLGSEADRISGLELGADDYLAKPFNPLELAARLKALLKRAGGAPHTPGMYHCGDLIMDAVRHTVSCRARQVELTSTEFRILQFLISHQGRVFSREEIIAGALGQNVVVLGRTIDVHVMSLRRKLRDCGTAIQTVRGFGYKCREEQA